MYNENDVLLGSPLLSNKRELEEIKENTQERKRHKKNYNDNIIDENDVKLPNNLSIIDKKNKIVLDKTCPKCLTVFCSKYARIKHENKKFKCKKRSKNSLKIVQQSVGPFDYNQQILNLEKENKKNILLNWCKDRTIDDLIENFILK
jgi:hypothetical protein